MAHPSSPDALAAGVIVKRANEVGSSDPIPEPHPLSSLHGSQAGPLPYRGTCFGFEVRSLLPFQYLRTGQGLPLAVTEAAAGEPPPEGESLLQWKAIPGKRTGTRLFRADGGFGVQMGSGVWFHLDLGRSEIRISHTEMPRHREGLLWTTPAALALVSQKDLALHAAAVEIEGRAILLTGPSGSGKTSTAAAFAAQGCRLLADDLIGCRPNGTPAVLPGPAVLRMRRDAADRLAPAGATVSYESNDRLHFSLQGSERGSGNSVPLTALIRLDADTDPFEVRRIRADQAVSTLWAQSFYLPEAMDRTTCFRNLVDLAARVPMWRVHRPPRWSDLPGLVERIHRLATQSPKVREL